MGEYVFAFLLQALQVQASARGQEQRKASRNRVSEGKAPLTAEVCWMLSPTVQNLTSHPCGDEADSQKDSAALAEKSEEASSIHI